MIKIQLEVITPLGKFISNIKDVTEKELEGLTELIQCSNRLTYFTIDGIGGDSITLASEVCKNSVFIIKTIES